MIQALTNKKGMTLTELLIGLLLFAIIAAITSALLLPMLRAHTAANEFAEYNTLLDNIANEVIGDLAAAAEPLDPVGWPIDISEAGDRFSIVTDGRDIAYAIDADGLLLKDVDGSEAPVLPDWFYARGHENDRSVRLTVDRAGSGGEAEETAYILTVTILFGDGESISRAYAARPLVLNQYTE